MEVDALSGAGDSPPLRALYVGPLPPMRGGSAIVWMRLLRQLHADGLTVHALAPLPTPEAGTGRPWPLANRRLPYDVTRYPVPTHSSLLSQGSSDMTYRSHEADWIARLLPRLLSELLQEFRKVNRVVAVASHLAGALERLGLRPVDVIRNPVDLTSFAPRPASLRLREALDISPQSTIVLHVSNLKAVKRPMDLVAAAEIAARRDARIAYVIVGDGALRRPLEDAVARRGLATHFRFVGWIDDRIVPDYINLADLVVMPSETEGQSLVALETQACGRVLLASNIPAFQEMVTDGETGLLFRRTDIADLAGRLVMAAESPELRAAIGARAREAVAPHAIDQSARRYAALLRSVAGTPSSRRGAETG